MRFEIYKVRLISIAKFNSIITTDFLKSQTAFSPYSFTFAAKFYCMKLSHLSETLIGSEIVKLGGEALPAYSNS